MPRLKHIEAEDETRRVGVTGGLIIVAPVPGPKTFQGPGDITPPFEGGGRQADLPGGYDQRAAADADWRAQLLRNTRQDKQALGQPRGPDGTPWVKSARY